MKQRLFVRPPIIFVFGVVAGLLVLLFLLPFTRHSIRRALIHSVTVRTWRTGDRYTPLTFTPVGDSSGRVQSRKHHCLLINVFTSWCPPCKQELPDLLRFSGQFKNRVDVVGVDQAERPEIVKQFADAMSVNYPVVIDDQQLTQHVIGVRAIPTSVLVGRDGIIKTIHQGPLTYNDFVTMLHSSC